MKKAKPIIALMGVWMLLFFCGNNASAQEVKIGTQTWATKNLDVSTFRNGDTIPEAKTEEEWKKAGEEGKPAWRNYDNDPENGIKYGKLYNWYAVNDPRGLAPKGWHIPTDEEWIILTNYLNGDTVVDKKMKSTEELIEWKSKMGNDINKCGGFADSLGGRLFNTFFRFFGTSGFWWSSSAKSDGYASNRYEAFFYGIAYAYHYDESSMFPVRVLRD